MTFYYLIQCFYNGFFVDRILAHIISFFLFFCYLTLYLLRITKSKNVVDSSLNTAYILFFENGGFLFCLSLKKKKSNTNKMFG